MRKFSFIRDGRSLEGHVPSLVRIGVAPPLGGYPKQFFAIASIQNRQVIEKSFNEVSNIASTCSF
jgi:hypothetical protein